MPNDVMGSQVPRVLWTPEYASSTGQEAIELCAMAGLVLDPWQCFTLDRALGERSSGRWTSFEVGICAPRQSGKDALLEARGLTGLYLLDERLLVHSAHEFATSLEAFYRLLALIDGCSDLSRRVKRVSRSHGEEGIEMLDGKRIRFRTRTKGGGRGFSCDWLALNEAMDIPEAMHAALLPTLSARPNPQVWYCGSAVDQQSMDHGVVFSRVRERALKGGDPSLMYVEFSAVFDHPDAVTAEAAVNPETWAQSNPALNVRISGEHVGREQRSMDARTFAVERLNVGDWPATDGSAGRKISDAQWADCKDAESEAVDPVVFAFDVTPDRRYGCISAAGKRQDGLAHLEVIELAEGTGWMVDRILALAANHETAAVVFSNAGPAASIAADVDEDDGDLEARLKRLRVELKPAMAQDEAKACGGLYDAVADCLVRHLGTTELEQALKGAATRPLGDAWAWARRTSRANISPLVACTLALWGLQTTPHRPRVRVVSLADALDD